MTRVLASAVFALSLCTFSSASWAQGVDIAPPTGKASIVIFRAAKEPLLSAHNVEYPIAYDEQWISKLPKGQYLVFPAWPGRHRIAPAIRSDQMPTHAASEWDSPGAPFLDLDVAAGETYYIKANPGAFRFGGTDTMERVGRVAFELMSREAAQNDLAGSKPVDWLKDLQGGTLAEVLSLSAQAVNTGEECGVVEWTPDLDKVRTSTFKRMSVLRGTLFFQDDSLVLHLKSAEPVAVVIPYTEIARAEVKNKVRMRAVVIGRKNGHVDSFTVLPARGVMIDRERTQFCGEHLASKLGS
jgi:hypothetical protein